MLCLNTYNSHLKPFHVVVFVVYGKEDFIFVGKCVLYQQFYENVFYEQCLEKIALSFGSVSSAEPIDMVSFSRIGTRDFFTTSLLPLFSTHIFTKSKHSFILFNLLSLFFFHTIFCDCRELFLELLKEKTFIPFNL